MSEPITILSTRMLQATELEKLPPGIRVVHANFIQKKIVVPAQPPTFTPDAIVLTSKTAVEAWVHMKALWMQRTSEPVFCTAFATRQLAEDCNLTIAGVAANATDLADVILQAKKFTSLLFVGSDRRRDELPRKLKAWGIAVDECVAYHTELTPHNIKEPFQAVLFYSPSTVDSFLVAHTPNVRAFCLGTTTANHARTLGFQKIIVAAEPTVCSLIDQVQQYYHDIVYAKK